MLADIDTWVLDLDNTLYPAGSALAVQLTDGILSTIAEYYGTDVPGARRIQSELVAEYGTSLRGAMLTGTIDPHEFLGFERRMDYSVIGPDPALAGVLEELPGRRYVYTNGSAYHAEQVLTRLGLTEHIDGVFDILAGELIPKPYAESLDAFLARFGVDPARSAMFDDLEVNLALPHERGMTTVWVTAGTPYEQLAERRWRAADLPSFLRANV
ncbi:putative hydrolase of the HAD superfamily [Kribbella aluminosa]|uniref:Hydrolase of the HAD superfamily n=1 Tax=Kribbella aluminosa TaxID=416017 RepID=A0ABS4UPB0_9ACTN|nr:HAD-IA family hydrolase [Kribbella aluminosa]MBP2353455.1 putative hydrolase of the HAD superfamily [Kribbella aluminosa]